MKTKRKPVKPVDRRIQKTKKLLSDALVALIVEKGYDAVSVKEIIDRANVGRSTFYAHFEDKEQLLLWGHDTFQRLLTESVLSPYHGSRGININFLFLYQHIQEQHKLVHALINEQSGLIVMNQLQSILEIRIEEYFKKNVNSTSDKAASSLLVRAATAAMVALVVRWMEQGMPFTPEEMAKQSESLLLKMMS